MEQTSLKKYLVLKIIAFEPETTNSHDPELGICHWQSIFLETPLRFNTSLRDVFSKSKSPRVIKKYDENALIPIWQEFRSL